MSQNRAGRWGKILLAIAATFALLALASTGISAAVSAATAPDSVVIKGAQKKKPPVPFPHKAHVDKGYKCKDCHHKNDAGKEAACTSCHKADKDGDTPEAKKIFHKKCAGCHKKMHKAGEKSGPTKCKDCHKG